MPNYYTYLESIKTKVGNEILLPFSGRCRAQGKTTWLSYS